MLLDLDRHQPEVLLRRALALSLLFGALISTSCSSGTGSGPAASLSVACPSGDALSGIYSPKRLTVLDTCRWFEGTVLVTDRKDDGDLHILMKPDPGSTKFLNVENVNEGGMVIEIVPGQDLSEPAVGEHLAIFGTWVLDEHNGWNEIHPVWAIRSLDRGTLEAVTPPPSPLYEGDSQD